MKHLTKLTVAFLMVLLVCGTARSQSQEEMKAWQDFMTPGDIHKMMAKWDGKWNEEITMWMQPGAPPQKYNATCINKMILGGRYQESKHSGNIMGMPFEGISTTAWDNGRKLFVSTWIDNMGTGIVYMEGAWDGGSKAMTLKGKSTDPMTGNVMDVREIFTIVDDNTQKLEMFMVAGGSEFKTMEIVFKRAK